MCACCVVGMLVSEKLGCLVNLKSNEIAVSMTEGHYSLFVPLHTLENVSLSLKHRFGRFEERKHQAMPSHAMRIDIE